MAGKWSAEETALLKELLTAHTVQEARQKLGRSEYAVRTQMRKLKDSKDPVKYEDMNREDGEDIRRMYKKAENKMEQLKILQELYPSYTKEAILAAAQHDPFRESDKFYEQITKEKTKMAQIQKYARETREAVVKDVLLNGMTQSEAAEKYGVNPKSVSYWCRTAKEKQQAFMDYAEKVENEKKKTAADTERAVEDARPYAEITTGSASELVELRYDEPERQAVEAENKTEDVFPATHFKPVNNQEEIQRDVREAIPYAEITTGSAAETAVAETGTEKRFPVQKVDENTIKAAAYDEICFIVAEYHDRSEREMLFYINGVIRLAERLQGGNIWN